MLEVVIATFEENIAWLGESQSVGLLIIRADSLLCFSRRPDHKQRGSEPTPKELKQIRGQIFHLLKSQELHVDSERGNPQIGEKGALFFSPISTPQRLSIDARQFATELPC